MNRNEFIAAGIDTQKVADLLRDAAARFIIPRFKALSSEQIRSKSSRDDLVTDADVEAEHFLHAELLKMYPETKFLGEECVSRKEVSLDLLQDKNSIVWIADPVDGTYNFVNEKNEFGLMLSCVVNGETRFSWIYDIIGNRMMIAEKGKGAFLNGEKLQTAPPRPLSECTVYAERKYFPKREQDESAEQKEKDELREFTTLRCSAHEYLRVLTGQADAILYRNVLPWDHLAGALAVQEAGGCVMKWDGMPYTPQDKTGGIIVTANKSLLDRLQAGTIPKMMAKFEKPKP